MKINDRKAWGLMGVSSDFIDSFDRGDGVLANGWSYTGSWNIVGNKLVGDPAITGSNFITNGDFETGNPPTGWNASASNSIAQNADVRPMGVGNAVPVEILRGVALATQAVTGQTAHSTASTGSPVRAGGRIVPTQNKKAQFLYFLNQQAGGGAPSTAIASVTYDFDKIYYYQTEAIALSATPNVSVTNSSWQVRDMETDALLSIVPEINGTNPQVQVNTGASAANYDFSFTAVCSYITY